MGLRVKEALTWRNSRLNTPYSISYDPGSWMLIRQIGFGDSKYWIISDQLIMGHVTKPKFLTKNRLKIVGVVSLVKSIVFCAFLANWIRPLKLVF